VAALWYRRPAYRRDLAVAGFWGGILSLGILVVVGVSALADFGGFWTQFHLLSFSNDLWLLDPSKDYLIMMFPEGFWADSMMVVAGLTAFLALVTCGLSWFYLKRASVACQSVEPTPTP
jgi:integral membrane protein (TIGR01906 family)